LFPALVQRGVRQPPKNQQSGEKSNENRKRLDGTRTGKAIISLTKAGGDTGMVGVAQNIIRGAHDKEQQQPAQSTINAVTNWGPKW